MISPLTNEHFTYWNSQNLALLLTQPHKTICKNYPSLKRATLIISLTDVDQITKSLAYNNGRSDRPQLRQVGGDCN